MSQLSNTCTHGITYKIDKSCRKSKFNFQSGSKLRIPVTNRPCNKLPANMNIPLFSWTLLILFSSLRLVRNCKAINILVSYGVGVTVYN